MSKVKRHELRLRTELWLCRKWKSWQAWWAEWKKPFVVTGRWVAAIYVVSILVVALVLLARMPSLAFRWPEAQDLQPQPAAGDRQPADTSSGVRIPGAILGGGGLLDFSELTQEEAESPAIATEHETPPEATQVQEQGLEPEPEPVAAATVVLQPLDFPIADGRIQNEYAASVKWSTLGDWRPHLAVDITVASTGEDVLAAARGTVRQVIVADPAWGNIIIIDHGGGWTTSYSNVNPAVAVGQTVAAQQVIGQVQDNPPWELLDPLHLHFILQQNGQPVDPSQKWR